MLERPDIVIDIDYDVKSPDATNIRTNAKREALSEILEAWMLASCREKDASPANVQDKYHIRIGLFLDNYDFGTVSNAGNRELTRGIVADTCCRLERLAVSGFEKQSG